MARPPDESPKPREAVDIRTTLKSRALPATITPTPGIGESTTLPREESVERRAVTSFVDPSPEMVSPGLETSRYELRRELGEGGMGVVRLYRDRWIGREVALKIARKERHVGSGATSRFLREVRVQGQLEHPSVVPVYDIGMTPDREPYFTMKRIRGNTLEEIVAGIAAGDAEMKSAFSRRKLLSAFNQVCLTMELAHQRQIIHRDLKPANVMLGEFGEVYVLDWGVARLANAEDPEPRTELAMSEDGLARTEAGALLGTPGYMPPEQVRGQVDAISPRSDIYALGAILFEILALSPLNDGKSSTDRLAKALAVKDARPSARRPYLDVPPELDDVCVRATALDPADRYASARELSTAVERYLDGERDTERRRDLADEHVALALSAIEESARPEGDAEGLRAKAMRLLSQALAFDPLHPEARGELMKLLLAAPGDLPPSAEAELAEVNRRDRVKAARAAAIAFASWFLIFPLILFAGVRDWPHLVVLLGLLVGLIGYASWVVYTGKATPPYLRYIIPLTFVLVAFLSCFFGPLVLVPGSATTVAAVFLVALRATPETRRFILAMSMGAVMIPMLLIGFGVYPQVYAVEGGKLTIAPFLMEFTQPGTTLFLVAASFLLVLTGNFLVASAGQKLMEAERRVFVQAWRLRQLLPEGADGSSVAPPKG